ncbi:MAG: hypothetical protein M1825_000361 [Sarcosagium campestre]|nr:MAG: hypothetical protein M1825_000361 [Sarcosagium campestre]
MPDQPNEARAEGLAVTALKLIDEGQSEAASRALREAVSLSPQNVLVKDAFTRIQQDESVHVLLKLCRFYIEKGDEAARKEAVEYLARSAATLPNDVGDECMKLVFERDSLSAADDEPLAALLTQNLGARAYLASRLGDATTEVFGRIWVLGDESLNALITVVLDSAAWLKQSVREGVEKDVLLLLIAKLLEAGQDHENRAMKGLARLFAADSLLLGGLIDAESLEVILARLDMRASPEVRSQATMATAKYLEAAQDQGTSLLSTFITSRVEKGTRNDLIVAFSAAAALFPILPSVIASLFLTPGFVEILVPTVKKTSKTSKVRPAVLELLSAACIDKACRDAIRKNCSDWLENEVENGTERDSSNAVVVLAKVRGASHVDKPGSEQRVQEAGKDMDGLVDRFKTMLDKNGDDDMQSALEGLAYATLQPKVKDRLGRDSNFLKHLVTTLERATDKSTATFGGLTVIANLTTYRPKLSEEEKRVSELKAYANASKPNAEPDPLDDDDHVTARCKVVLDANIVPLMVQSSKSVSLTSLGLILKIMLALSKTAKHRGLIAQQGGVKLLLHSYALLSTKAEKMTPDSPDPALRTSLNWAAHALARILISVDPTLIFTSSTLSIPTAIRPLLSLIQSQSDTPTTITNLASWSRLSVFEALLALTNLASTDDPTRDTIIRLAFPRIEELLLADNKLVQRAAVELICNLMASPQGVARFADGSKPAANRLHILLALTDVDDYATRRAAGGALAMLTEWDPAVDAVLRRERGVSLLVGLCTEDKDELRLRGVVCLKNLVDAPGDAGQRAVRLLREVEGSEKKLMQMLKKTSSPMILEAGVEVLKKIKD